MNDGNSSTCSQFIFLSSCSRSYHLTKNYDGIYDSDYTSHDVTNDYFVNDDVVNDGVYEYETIARPFMARFSKLILGQLIEKKKRSSFDFDYFHFLKSLLDE